MPTEEVGHQAGVAAGVGSQFIELDVSADDSILSKREGKIPAPEQRAHPGSSFLGIAVRRGIVEWRVAHTPEITDDFEAGICARIGATQGGRNESEGPLELNVTVKNGKLFTAAGGQTFQMMPIEKATFVPVDFDGITLTFKVEGEKVTGAALKQGTNVTQLKRIEEAKEQPKQ